MAKKFLTDINIAGGVYDSSGDIGSSGQVLSSTGSGINWTDANSAVSVIYQDGFTGNGSATAFTLANSIDNENKTQVYIDGVYQHKDNYSLSGTTLTFSTAPPNTSDIEVISFSSVSAADDILYDDDFTSAGLMTTDGSGVYSITTNNSSNWNTAYTHSQAAHAPANAEQNVQSDWTATSGDSFIQNKPTIPSGNQIIDWTADQGSTEIHSGNYINTTYTVGDGGLTQNNFTNALKTKLDGIETSATADQTDAEIRTAVEAATDSNVFTDADHTKLNAIEASADVTDTTNVTAAGALMDSEVTNLADVKAFDTTDYATAAQGALAASAQQPPSEGAFANGDKTKLDGIAAGAEVNVQSDWNSTSGDNLILNKPSIPSITGLATETYVDTAVSDLVDSSPATLNTLNELAAALGDDPNFATTTATSIGTKLPLAGGTLTGTLTINNAASDKKIAFRRTGGKSISIEHDTSQIYFYNETDSSVLFTIANNANLTTTGSISVSGGNSGQWNTAYGWGDHASGGYLTSLPSHNHAAGDITSGQLAAARNTANLVDVGGSLDAQGIYFRGTTEVISGEGWCTAQYAYNHNDGFLFLNRNSSNTAFPTFHIGGWNNAGHAGYTDADGMMTLTRSDGSKSAGATYAGTGLSNTSYWTRMVKTTAKTIFKDAQDKHEFSGQLEIKGSLVWAAQQTNAYTYSGADSTGMYIERVSTAGAGSALADIRLQARNNNAGNYSSIKILGSTSSLSFITAGSSALTINSSQKSTFTGQLAISGSGGAASPNLAISNSLSSAFMHTGELFTPNMTASQANIFVIGKAGSTKQSGYIGYNWSSNASNNNYVTIGHWGQDHMFRVYGDVITTTVGIRSAADVRGIIFYDQNDTSYYVNPNANSKLTTADFIVNASSTIALTSAGTNASQIKAGAGDELYLGGNNTWQMRLSGGNILMDNGGYALSNGSMRAPIFYDSADTAYYGDFNGKSHFNEIAGVRVNRATSEGWAETDAWSVGTQTGYFGGAFTINGSSDENNIAYEDMPHPNGSAVNKKGLVWKVRTNSSDSGADGGWNKTIGGVNYNRGHISVLYVKRVADGNGNFYHGTTTCQNLDGSTNTNPYFQAVGAQSLPLGVWCVSIGYIRGNNDSSTTSTSFSGVYRLDTGERILGATDYRFAQSTTSQHRCFLYYATNTSTELWFTNPGFYEINGLEPNMNELLMRPEDRVDQLRADVDMRAPIFYDSNNTTYYSDFASTNDSINIAGSLRAATYNKPAIISVSSGNTSAGASIAIQQETSEGWTAIFADFEPNTGWGLYHDNPSNHFLITSESSSGAIGAGFTVPSRSSGNRTAYKKQLFDQTTGDFTTGRDGYALGSFRAPIFYDSGNTNYFVDPGGNTSRIQGFVKIGNSSTYNTDDGSWGTRLVVASTIHARIDVAQDANAMRSTWFCHTGNTGSLFGTVTGHDQWLYSHNAKRQTLFNGYSQEEASYRAPVFYDSNDTGYYINPNGLNRMSQIMTGKGSNDSNGVASISLNDGQLLFRTNTDYNHKMWYYDGINFSTNPSHGHIRFWADGSSRTNGSGGSTIILDSDCQNIVTKIYGQTQSPIYYDLNNTGYYVHGDSGSRLLRLGLNVAPDMAAAGDILKIQGGNNGLGCIKAISGTYSYGIRIEGSNLSTQLTCYSSSTALTTQINFETTGNSSAGKITTTGNSTAYNTLSDYRVKENVIPINDSISRLNQLKPSRFNFIGEPNKTVDGFIAHEVQDIVPEAIVGEKDEVDDDGNPIYQGIDQAKLVPLLVAAIKELEARVQELENN